MKPKLKGFPHFQLLGRVVAAVAMLALSTPHLFAGDINVTYITGAEVPVSSNGFTAMGKKVNITLNFAPAPGTQLMVVQNTGPGIARRREVDCTGNAFSDLSNQAAVSRIHK